MENVVGVRPEAVDDKDKMTGDDTAGEEEVPLPPAHKLDSSPTG